MKVQTTPIAVASSVVNYLLTSGVLDVPQDFVDQKTLNMVLMSARNTSARVEKESGRETFAEEVFKNVGLYKGCQVQSTFSSDNGNTIEEINAILTASCLHKPAAVLFLYKDHAACLAGQEGSGFWFMEAPSPDSGNKPSMCTVKSPVFDTIPLQGKGFKAVLIRQRTEQVPVSGKGKEEEEEEEEQLVEVVAVPTKVEEEEEEEEEEVKPQKKTTTRKKNSTKRKAPATTTIKKKRTVTKKRAVTKENR